MVHQHLRGMNILSILAWEDAVEVEEITLDSHIIALKVKTVTSTGQCPMCQQISSYIHSHYRRGIADLPWASKLVKVSLLVKRFRCQNLQCSRKIFSERLTSTPAYSRRTRRMQYHLAQIGFQLGGQAGAKLAALLGLPVSDTTLIRIVQATEKTSYATPKVLGVDDWSLKKGRTYGTILVDMEKQQPIELLPDREAETLTRWLQDHPGVEIICRDRASCYAEGASQGAPNAMQVADRWHLLKNLGEALQRMLEKQNAALRTAAYQLAQAHQQQEQKHQEMSTQEVTGPNISLSSSTAQRALIFQEVKRLLAEGYSNRGAARQLQISARRPTGIPPPRRGQ